MFIDLYKTEKVIRATIRWRVDVIKNIQITNTTM